MDSPAGMLLSIVLTAITIGVFSNGPEVFAWLKLHQEFAGWVQAVGGLLALAIAIYIGVLQVRSGRKLEYERYRREISGRITAVESLLSELIDTIDLLLDRREMRDPYDFPDLETFIDCEERLRNFDLLLFPSERLVSYLATLPRKLKRLHGEIHGMRASQEQLRSEGRVETTVGLEPDTPMDICITIERDLFEEGRRILEAGLAICAEARLDLGRGS